jgi:hypothetical protein
MSSFRYFENVLKESGDELIETIEALQLSDHQKKIIEAYKQESDLIKSGVSLSAYEAMYERLHPVQQPTVVATAITSDANTPTKVQVAASVASCLSELQKDLRPYPLKKFRHIVQGKVTVYKTDIKKGLWQDAYAKLLILNDERRIFGVSVQYHLPDFANGSVSNVEFVVSNDTRNAHYSIHVIPQVGKHSNAIKFKFLGLTPNLSLDLVDSMLLAIVHVINTGLGSNLTPSAIVAESIPRGQHLFLDDITPYSHWCALSAAIKWLQLSVLRFKRDNLYVTHDPVRDQLILTVDYSRLSNDNMHKLLYTLSNTQYIVALALPDVAKNAVSAYVNLVKYPQRISTKTKPFSPQHFGIRHDVPRTNSDSPIYPKSVRNGSISFLNSENVNAEVFLNAVCATIFYIISQDE